MKYRYRGVQATVCLPQNEHRTLKLVASYLGISQSKLIRESLLNYYRLLQRKGLLPQDLDFGNLAETVLPLIEKKYLVENIRLKAQEELAKQEFLRAKLSGFVAYFNSKEIKDSTEEEIVNLLRAFIRTRKKLLGLKLMKIVAKEYLTIKERGMVELRSDDYVIYEELLNRLAEILGVDVEEILAQVEEGGAGGWGMKII